MQINLSKLYAVLTGILSVGLVLYSGYFLYDILSSGPTPEAKPVVANIKADMFGAKIGKAANAINSPTAKISLKKKDYAFVDSPLYQSFTDMPETVPLSESRGRPDPFVPYYAAP